jgi:type I restriction enzyme S subunit
MNSGAKAWASCSLDQLTSLIKDGSHGTHEDTAEGVPFLSAKDVRDGTLEIPDDCRRISEIDYAAIHKNYSIAKDDILLTIVGTIGRSCRITGSEPRFTIQRSVGVIRSNTIDPAYLYHYFHSEHFQRILNGFTNASAQGGVYLGSLAKCSVAFPTSKREQIKIAEILSALDRAIEQTEALIAKQQRIKTGLVQDLLTRGIDEHANLRSEQTHPFKDSPLGPIPLEWEVGDLEGVAEFVTSGSRGWAKYYSDEGPIFLRIGNLTRNHINLRLEDVVFVNPPTSSEGKRTSVSAGDVLISITADLGVIGVIPERFGEAYVNQHIALVRLIHSKVNPRFIGWFLSSRRGQTQFEKLNESGAKAGLNLPTIRKLLVPVMKVSEQTRIAEILDSNTEKTNSYHFRLTKLRSIKTALMQDLLTGEKRVAPLLESEPKLEKVYAAG